MQKLDGMEAAMHGIRDDLTPCLTKLEAGLNTTNARVAAVERMMTMLCGDIALKFTELDNSINSATG